MLVQHGLQRVEVRQADLLVEALVERLLRFEGALECAVETVAGKLGVGARRLRAVPCILQLLVGAVDAVSDLVDGGQHVCSDRLS